jgi:hypothetical protein
MDALFRPVAVFCFIASSMVVESRSAPVTPSPENQVFQWSASGESDAWPDGSKARGTLHLWVPEACRKVRGLLVLATNVPEHRLVGDPVIRRACEENDLALVWSVPTFWRFGKVATQPGGEVVDVKKIPGGDALQVAFLQSMLDALAGKSGYSEIATAPWLPVGESGHLLMVCGMVNQTPERCIAGICVKNPHLPENKTVPMLWTLGTAQEWGQTAKDPRENWKAATFNYQGWVGDRMKADWPLSILVEPGSGHFYCTEAMTKYLALYVNSACRARLSDDGSPTLKPVSLDRGVLADLPLPGRKNALVTPYAEAAPTDRARPWFFDEATARAAQKFAAVDWDAATAMPSVTGVENCIVNPFSFNSVTEITVVTDSEFSVRSGFHDSIPVPFAGAGASLIKPPVVPIVEWICGPFAPLGDGRFRIALDRTWKTGAACYLAVSHPASDGVRFGVQPAAVKLMPNGEGAAQTITFDPIPEVKAGTESIKLTATSDAGLPVNFFVVSGPAIVRGDRLEFTTNPPRSRFPIEVTVAAWQWGRHRDPKIRTADIVRQTFQLVR